MIDIPKIGFEIMMLDFMSLPIGNGSPLMTIQKMGKLRNPALAPSLYA